MARFLRLAEVSNRVGLSRATIYRLMDAGEFPKQIQITLRSVAWLEKHVDDWVQARVEKRGTDAPASCLVVR